MYAQGHTHTNTEEEEEEEKEEEEEEKFLKNARKWRPLIHLEVQARAGHKKPRIFLQRV